MSSHHEVASFNGQINRSRKGAAVSPSRFHGSRPNKRDEESAQRCNDSVAVTPAYSDNALQYRWPFTERNFQFSRHPDQDGEIPSTCPEAVVGEEVDNDG